MIHSSLNKVKTTVIFFFSCLPSSIRCDSIHQECNGNLHRFFKHFKRQNRGVVVAAALARRSRFAQSGDDDGLVEVQDRLSVTYQRTALKSDGEAGGGSRVFPITIAAGLSPIARWGDQWSGPRDLQLGLFGPKMKYSGLGYHLIGFF